MNSNSALRAIHTKWTKLTGWKPGRLAQNTILATFWQAIRLILQFAYLVLVARVLGVEGYGLFSGIIAIAASLSPLVGLGFGTILVKEVSRVPDRFPVYWAKTLRATALSIPAMLTVMFLLAYALLPPDGLWPVVILVAMAELVAVPFMVAGSLAYQAHEQLGRTVFNHIQMNLARFVAIAILAAAGRNNLLEFAWVYFGATSLAALLSLAQVRRAFGPPTWQHSSIAGQAKEGMSFSLSVLANSTHGEIDKTLLLRLSSADIAGAYSIANRVVSAASIPLVTYVLAVAPRLFRSGEFGINTSARVALQLLLPVLIYGALAGGGVFVIAPWLPHIFGNDFMLSASIIKALAVLPLLTGISLMLLAVLSSSNAQHVRVWLEIISLGVNVSLNVALIPTFGAFGAVWAVLASQSILAGLAATAIYLLSHRTELNER